MKRRVVVEIDVAEGMDMAWDLDDSGFQAFGDSVLLYATVGGTTLLANALSSKETSLASFIEIKNDMIFSAKMVAYISENDEYVEFDKNHYQFLDKRKIL